MTSSSQSIAISPPIRWRRSLWRIIRVAFVVGILGFIVSRLDLETLLRSARTIQPGYVILGFGLWSLSFLTATFRWYILARTVAPNIAFIPLLFYNFIGLFYGQFLPSSLSSDVARGYYLAKAHPNKIATFGSSLVERLIGVTTNGIIGVLAFSAAPELLRLFHLDHRLLLAALGIILLGAGIGAVLIRKRPIALSRLPKPVRAVYENIQPYTTRPGVIAASALISAGYLLLWGLTLWLLGLAVGIQNLSPSTLLLIVVAINIAQFIPLSINGWGVREGALVGLLGVYGVASETAILLSLLWALVNLLAAGIGGILVLINYRETPKTVNPMFKFGENWHQYAQKAMTDAKLQQAKTALGQLLNLNGLSGRTFMDIGCGSRLHAAAAALMDAEEIYAYDVDLDSVTVTQATAARFLNAEQKNRIHVSQASILAMPPATPQTDIVYSWSVLHHTGDMYNAIRHATRFVRPDGLFVIAIYNRHWTSPIWKRIKWLYNHLPGIGQRLMYYLFYGVIFTAKFAVSRENPLKKDRRMDFGYDVIDWIGGYPYEYASTDEITRFVEPLGFQIERVIPAQVGTGCNEFVFRRIH